MIAFNFGPQKEYPQIVIGTKERPPMSDVIAAIADLGPLGFKVKASELRDLLQLTKPEGDDEVIGMPPAPAAGAVDADGNPLVGADVKPKANPHPEINPDSDTRALLTARREARERRALMTAQRMARAMQTAQVTPVLDALTARLADEAGAALAAMTDEVKACFLAAEDLADLAARLKALKLDDTAFMTAMGQGMALANLAGQAALLDEIAPHR
jgi:phage gp29-like protein